ncbi:hypothetical protein [Sabulibacter ruber]|uniref:hypothetical protein n=1 Tax=Sabulibacter ruber TaxID=2811901 RepID=UPI001A971FD4|nr:hypothetical protein [Sabulibacter ruber]
MEKLRPLISARAAYHAQLGISTKQDERKELAFRILDLSDKITPLWDLYEHAKEHEYLPEAKKEEPLTRDKGLLYKSLTNLRAQRSKLKKKPERLLDLQEMERNIKRIEEALAYE